MWVGRWVPFVRLDFPIWPGRDTNGGRQRTGRAHDRSLGVLEGELHVTSSNRPMRRLLAAAVVAAVGLSGISAALAVPASAAPADEQLVSANPNDNTPRVLDGQVNAIVRVGETVIVGGSFTKVREAPTNSPELARSGLFAFNRSTGQIDASFVPILGTGDPLKKPVVNTLVPTADGTGVYVGGEFRTVNGSGPARFQLLDLATGQRVASSANGAFNKSVMDAKLVGGRLYVAGAFTSVGGIARGGLASLDPSSGELTTAVTTSFAGVGNGGITTVRKIDLTPSGDRLIAIGNFMSVGGVSRSQVAMLDTSGASATVASWSTTKFPRGCSSSFDTYLRDVDFAPDGSFFVIVTTGGWGGTAAPVTRRRALRPTAPVCRTSPGSTSPVETPSGRSR